MLAFGFGVGVGVGAGGAYIYFARIRPEADGRAPLPASPVAPGSAAGRDKASVIRYHPALKYGERGRNESEEGL